MEKNITNAPQTNNENSNKTETDKRIKAVMLLFKPLRLIGNADIKAELFDNAKQNTQWDERELDGRTAKALRLAPFYQTAKLARQALLNASEIGTEQSTVEMAIDYLYNLPIKSIEHYDRLDVFCLKKVQLLKKNSFTNGGKLRTPDSNVLSLNYLLDIFANDNDVTTGGEEKLG